MVKKGVYLFTVLLTLGCIKSSVNGTLLPGLIVADSQNNRVLFWGGYTQASKTPAVSVLGQTNFVNRTSNGGGSVSGSTFFGTHLGSDGVRLVVGDFNNNRALIWNTLPFPSARPADIVLGQPDLVSNAANNGGSPTCASCLSGPALSYISGTRLILCDDNNNRILIWNNFPTYNQQPADLVLGQSTMNSNGTSVSASSLNQANDVWSDGTHLVVADQGNNRILIWNSFPMVNGQAADLVLGQPSFFTAIANNGGSPSCASCLSTPWGVAGFGGRFFVSDTGNNRVLIWNTFPTYNNQPADLVLGQLSFSGNTALGGASGLFTPQGLVYDGQFSVADRGHNRVLVWNSIPSNINQPADFVLGQPDFNSTVANNGGVSAFSLSAPTAVGINIFVSGATRPGGY